MSHLDKITDEMSGFEKLLAKIPGYKGYKEKELRREADKMLRDHIACPGDGRLVSAECRQDGKHELWPSDFAHVTGNSAVSGAVRIAHLAHRCYPTATADRAGRRSRESSSCSGVAASLKTSRRRNWREPTGRGACNAWRIASAPSNSASQGRPTRTIVFAISAATSLGSTSGENSHSCQLRPGRR